MAKIQPKPYINRHSQLRHIPIGPERRFDRIMTIMDKSTVLPKAVMYEDIDQAVFDWVDNTLRISYNGKRLPTYKLFSNQRISEYGQTWQYTDDEGNISMNFKTITRDNNPQKGENQGSLANVPGNRLYPLFKVPVTQESGDEIYEIYSMKQPVAVNLSYTVVMVCDKYRLLNELNTKIHDQFKSIECYLYPNGHPMPILLDTIEDESVYTINDRKYYSQAYKLKMMAYIIKPEDFDVIRVPSTFKIGFGPLKKEPKRNFVGCDIKKDSLEPEPSCTLPVEDIAVKKLPVVSIVDGDNPCQPDEDSPYYYKTVDLNVDFSECEDLSISFEMEINFGITNLVLENIHDFKIKVDDVDYDIEDVDDPKFPKGSIITIIIVRENDYGDSFVKFEGFDYDVVLDERYNPELPMDDVEKHEDINI